MSNPVEIKRIIAELHRVRAAKFEQDFKIAEREAEIERLRENMANQDTRMAQLLEELQALGVSTSSF